MLLVWIVAHPTGQFNKDTGHESPWKQVGALQPCIY